MLRRITDSPLVKINARYGAIAGVLCTGFVITMFYMGKHPFLINPLIDFRVFLFSLLLFFSLKEMRDYYQGGLMYFWQGTTGSFIFLAAAALVASLGIMTFGSLQPQFLSGYIEQFSQQIRNLSIDEVKQIGEDVVKSNLEQLQSTTLASLASLYAWQCFVIGFFISVIISVILRKQPKTE